MFYELWDLRTGNIVNTYDTEDEALATVRTLLTLNGAEYASALSLSSEDDDEKTSFVAKGADLALRANALKDAV
jgi:hypothetical protein